ncbi:TetR/AcrR family transcriptional regulator [Antrihabitans stalactiti]|nr:TetR/AcrR family transcriptional regulator [Antrihabitans stalactiti]
MPRPDREAQILDLAETLFAERGFRKATMDELSARVGVTKPVIYEYFGSKDGVLSAVLAQARTGLFEATQAAVAGSSGPEDALRRSLQAFFEYTDLHRDAWSLMNHAATLGSGVVADEVDALRRQQADFTAAMMQEYGHPRDEREPEAFALVIIGACDQIARWRESKPDVTPERAAQYVFDVVWSGLRDRIDLE